MDSLNYNQMMVKKFNFKKGIGIEGEKIMETC